MEYDIEAPVSFGKNLKGRYLVEKPTEWCLDGIRSGMWKEEVEKVRTTICPDERRALKEALPYFTPSGTFKRRKATELKRHSGQMIMDLDNLTKPERIKAIQMAVADPFCMAAFHSAGGEGIKLIFRVPEMDPNQHYAVFPQVSERTKAIYKHSPDPSGRDVSRACFVSYDQGLWMNPSAEMLPVEIPLNPPQVHNGYISLCTCIPAEELVRISYDRVPYHVKPDGTVYTHFQLLALAKDLALHAKKRGVQLKDPEISLAASTFVRGTRASGKRLSRQQSSYESELKTMVSEIEKKEWFHDAASKWSRWRLDPEFPSKESNQDQLMFAIKRHCAEHRSKIFFIGARDAGLVIDANKNAAWKTLNELVRNGILEKLPKPKNPRHAQSYRLVN